MVFKKKATTKKKSSAPSTVKIEAVVPKVKDNSSHIEKIMNFLGYDKKRALKYNYYVKSSKNPSGVIKEDKLIEVFNK